MCTHNFRDLVCSVRCWSQPTQAKDVGRDERPRPLHCCYCLLPKAGCEHFVGSLAEQKTPGGRSHTASSGQHVQLSRLLRAPNLRGPEGPVIFYQSQQNSQSFFWDYCSNELIGSPHHWPSLQPATSSESRARWVVHGSVISVLEIPQLACWIWQQRRWWVAEFESVERSGGKALWVCWTGELWRIRVSRGK